MDLGVWEGVFLQAPLHDGRDTGPRVWLDLHGRRDGARFTGIVRPAVGWDLSRQTSVYAGYAWVPATVPGEGTAHEHRLWQQALWTEARGPVSVALRPRLEQRVAAGVDGVGVRARFMGRVQWDLRDPFALVASNEVFVGLSDSGFVPAGFDQNRVFAGPAIRGDDLRVELGLLGQTLLREGEWSTVGVVASNVTVAF